MITRTFFLMTAFTAIALLSGCQNQTTASPASSALPSFSAGVTSSADRADLIAQEHDRIAAKIAADELAATEAAAQAAQAQRLADEAAARIVGERQAAQGSNPDRSGAFTRDDVLGTVDAMTGLPVAVAFDATWCDAATVLCGGVYTRAPRAPSSVAELTVHMSDSPAWLYAKVGYKVTIHEIGHVLTSYYQPQILSAFGPAFLETNIEKIADCYLILHVGGTVGTSGYSFDGLESEVARWIVDSVG